MPYDRLHFRSLVTIGLLSAIAPMTLPTSAQADDRAAARALFDEGRRLMKGGKVAEACAKFEAASHLTQTTGVRLNLAVCWTKQGRTASAWGMYDEARALAERNGEAAAIELADKGKAELGPKLSKLVVTVASGTPGIEVTRDGEPVSAGAFGMGVPVDPGEHRIEAHAAGHKAWSSQVTVAGEGTQVTVAVPALESDAPAAVAVMPVPATAGGPAAHTDVTEDTRIRSSNGSTQRTIGLVTAGAGIVALGVGAYFGIKTASEKSDYQGHEVNGRCIDLTCQTDSHNAASDGNVSTVLVIAGAAVVAAGAVVWLTAPKAHEQGVTAKIAPAVGPRTAGLTLQGSF